LDKIPKEMLEGLGHIERNTEAFEDHYIMDLRSHNIDDFTLEYLNKFLLNSKIPNIRIYGGCIPIQALKENSISILDLSS
jgi:hypothetical protein